MIRSLYFATGLVLVGLAFVGAVLPVMPSTIFVILAAACFARSSPRFERWLLDHRQFGPSLVAWRSVTWWNRGRWRGASRGSGGPGTATARIDLVAALASQ